VIAERSQDGFCLLLVALSCSWLVGALYECIEGLKMVRFRGRRCEEGWILGGSRGRAVELAAEGRTVRPGEDEWGVYGFGQVMRSQQYPQLLECKQQVQSANRKKRMLCMTTLRGTRQPNESMIPIAQTQLLSRKVITITTTTPQKTHARH
jgi:hypothetical protein